MKLRFYSTGLVCIGLLIANLAQADLFFGGSYSFSSSPTPYSNTVNVAQVTPSPGSHVDKLIVTTTATLHGSVGFTNITGSTIGSGTGVNQGVRNASFDGSLLLFDHSGFIALSASDAEADASSLNGNYTAHQYKSISLDGVTDTQTFTINLGDTLDAQGNPIDSASLIAEFIGTGTVPVTLMGDAGYGGNIKNNINSLTFATMEGSFSFYYDVVPEPGTWISASMLLIFVGGTIGRSYWRRVTSKV